MNSRLDDISLPEQISCIEAELKRRWQTLPGQVEDGLLEAEDCDRQLMQMEAVRYSLRVLMEARDLMGADKAGVH